MEVDEKILSIIDRGELRNFIIGKDESPYYFPEDPSEQWGELVAFYANPSVSAEIKLKIKETVIGLFENPDRSSLETAKTSIIAGLTLCKIMNFTEIKGKLVAIVESGDVEYWDEKMKRELVSTVLHFQFPELKEFVQQFTK
jgi:hypothetical protein